MVSDFMTEAVDLPYDIRNECVGFCPKIVRGPDSKFVFQQRHPEGMVRSAVDVVLEEAEARGFGLAEKYSSKRRMLGYRSRIASTCKR